MPKEFSQTYVGQLRRIMGSRPLLVPGARVVIENGAGEVLLQRRSDFGVWGVPGGNGEIGESLHDTAVREALEETSLRLSRLDFFGLCTSPELETVTFPNGDVCQFVIALFHCKEFEGEPRASDQKETLALGWFSPHALPNMLPKMANTLRLFLHYKQTGRVICG